MLENDRMETTSTEVTSIQRRNDIEKSTWRTHRYFVDFESRIHVKMSTSNQCHNLHVHSPFKIDVTFTNIHSTWNFDVESMVNQRRSHKWLIDVAQTSQIGPSHFKANSKKSHFFSTSNKQANLNLDDLIIKPASLKNCWV